MNQNNPIPWPLWKKVLAYAFFITLSFATIWMVDQRVHMKSLMPHAGETNAGKPKQP